MIIDIDNYIVCIYYTLSPVSAYIIARKQNPICKDFFLPIKMFIILQTQK